jgi:hypothetical protein
MWNHASIEIHSSFYQVSVVVIVLSLNKCNGHQRARRERMKKIKREEDEENEGEFKLKVQFLYFSTSKTKFSCWTLRPFPLANAAGRPGPVRLVKLIDTNNQEKSKLKHPRPSHPPARAI